MRADAKQVEKLIEQRVKKSQTCKERSEQNCPQPISATHTLLQRGKVLVAMVRKRKLEVKPQKSRSKLQKLGLEAKPTPKENLHIGFNEATQELLVINKTKEIGSGTFGKCYSATYRKEYSALEKVMKTRDHSSAEKGRAK